MKSLLLDQRKLTHLFELLCVNIVLSKIKDQA